MKELFSRLYNKSAIKFYEVLKRSLLKEKKVFIVTANPETFMLSEKDDELRDLLVDSVTTVVPDGIGIVKAAKKLNYDVKERIPGIDIATELLELCNTFKKKVYLFGAAQEVMDSLKAVVMKKYPGIQLVGSSNGYVKDRDKIMADIVKKSPDVVMVALGIPYQEKLIYKYINKVNKGIFIGVGGSFDVISGLKKRAPKLFIKTNTEWLYRIIREPKRLKRFYNSNIKFMFKIRKYK